MPEYSSTTITPADSVKVPAMNGSTSGNFQLDALRNFILASKGQANGLASLDANGKLPAAQLPDLADDVLVYANYAAFPASGTAGKLYIAADTNKIYRWDDSLGTPAYVYLKVDWTDLTDGTVTVKKAECDASGNTITSTYETKADANDLKNALQATNARVENLEQKAGGYSVVNYRGTNAVPSGKAEYGLVERIVGKSRPWNNECKNGNFADDSEWNTSGMSVSYSDNKATLTTSSVSAFYQYVTPSMIQGHKYLYCANIETTASSVSVGIYRNSSAYAISSYSSSKFLATGIADIAESTSGYTFDLRIRINVGGSSTTVVSNVILRDLTLIFGSGNEPSTVAECVALCPDILTYDAYGYSLVDTVVEGVESVGVNIWDEVWELGALSLSTGADSPSSTAIRSEDYIPLEYGKEYYVLSPNPSSGLYACIYDENKNFLSARLFNTPNGLTITPTAEQKYMRFYTAYTATSYSGTVSDGIQICDNSYSDKTTYHPHFTDTLSLPSPVTLRSAGSVAEEAYLNEDGEAWKTNPLDNVDLGTLNWGYDSTYAFFYYLMNDRKEGIDFIADGYTNVGAVTDPNMANVPTMSIASNSVSGKWVYIKNTSKNASDLVNGHASWLEGVTLYYALPTPNAPTQLDPIQNNMIATEGGGTINTIQTQTTKIDNCLDVGYLAV